VNASGDRLAVIVPCFNEEKTVEATVEEIYAFAPELPVEVQVVLVDDGSTDDTVRVLHGLEERFGARVVINEGNLGVGRSILNLYDTFDPETWVSVMPGDGEIIFASMRNYVEVRERYDIILGYLHNPVIRTAGRRIASSAFTRITASLYGFPYRYLNGLKMYRARAFQGIDVVSGGHAFVAELLAKAILRDPGLRVGEVPFMMRGRQAGMSKAIRPGSVFRAVREVVAGYRSVSRYRAEVIRQDQF